MEQGFEVMVVSDATAAEVQKQPGNGGFEWCHSLAEGEHTR